MAKGYIIVNIPERCYTCALSDPYVTRCMYTKKKGMEKKKITNPFSKPDWCPIKEIPAKLKPNDVNGNFDFLDGYNNLIDDMFRDET